MFNLFMVISAVYASGVEKVEIISEITADLER